MLNGILQSRAWTTDCESGVLCSAQRTQGDCPEAALCLKAGAYIVTDATNATNWCPGVHSGFVAAKSASIRQCAIADKQD